MNKAVVSNSEKERSNDEGFRIWRVALHALVEGDIDKALGQFGDQFTFTDHSLGLEFTEKDRLREYFVKTGELFPESERTDHTVLSHGDVIVSEWTLAATLSEPFLNGSFRRLKIEAHGVSVVRVSEGRIVEWSEYYDQIRSGFYRLAGQFTDWVEV